MAIEIDEPTFVETVLHYGLLLGAVFQLVCIFAVIFIPQSQNDQERPVEEPRSSSNSNCSNQPQPLQPHSKKNKKEKKKFR
ncbi:Hypothetical predicted protein [Mytilus galloprovincialis]|uniref:Protein anon-73B1 n=1 Tax=Mytilus galloprovincialis TaxID=29158 RepID=A0A8B6CLP5_MYTGA|nr:Hypothetical predicted protein [Mytilus galloprovincialis]